MDAVDVMHTEPPDSEYFVLFGILAHPCSSVFFCLFTDLNIAVNMFGSVNLCDESTCDFLRSKNGNGKRPYDAAILSLCLMSSDFYKTLHLAQRLVRANGTILIAEVFYIILIDFACLY